jgi:hypothetical protein
MKNLEKIIEKYSNVEYCLDNFNVGGGLDGAKFASNRHEDACNDRGKLTLGKATAMFSKATGCDIDFVKAIINYAVPYMEWHHAGKLPKQYGGGMKKTYFLNGNEIVDIATNWQNYVEKLELSINQKRIDLENKKSLENLQHEFLQKNAKQIFRKIETPEFFYETEKEMQGKYGWFSSYGKSYNLTEYYSGWEFENAEKLQEFYNLKVSAQAL